ncbi:hypothetical protein BC941DRAFT_511293 [Chlamydoabsidia padenii]|nr:hypothetical protein BC941DRAFT_511293 [Chlamydoabsidia padenii]
MKSSFITLTAVASFVGYANAAMMFKDPWAQTKPWKSGEKALLKWTSDKADADKMCDIQMLNGDKLNSNIVATVTNPKSPVKCGVNEYEISPLNDFKSGKYWVRIGQADTDTWTYSGVFDFEGKGTVTELKLADGAEYPSAEGSKDGKTKDKMDDKKQSMSASPSMSAKASSSVVKASAFNSASGSNSVPPASTSASNAMPSVKKETKNEEKKKSASGAGSTVFQLGLVHQAVVMGLASLAAYVLAV